MALKLLPFELLFHIACFEYRAPVLIQWALSCKTLYDLIMALPTKHSIYLEGGFDLDSVRQSLPMSLKLRPSICYFCNRRSLHNEIYIYLNRMLCSECVCTYMIQCYRHELLLAPLNIFDDMRYWYWLAPSHGIDPLYTVDGMHAAIRENRHDEIEAAGKKCEAEEDMHRKRHWEWAEYHEFKREAIRVAERKRALLYATHPISVVKNLEIRVLPRRRRSEEPPTQASYVLPSEDQTLCD